MPWVTGVLSRCSVGCQRDRHDRATRAYRRGARRWSAGGGPRGIRCGLRPLRHQALRLPPADPQPEPGPLDLAPAPAPEPPKDIAIPTPEPDEPKDIAIPTPEPDEPNGPGDLTNPKPCPTHGVDCTPDDDEPKDEPKDGGGDTDDEVFDSITLPTRIDAGLASEEQGGLDLTWLVVGGAVVTAPGAGFAARKRASGNA